jgi:hypothetical protein
MRGSHQPRARMADDTLAWLLAGDPAIRWQALRDLGDASAATVERQRRKVAAQGWGARLLERQDREGTWGGGLYTPKWISTTYTMLTLRDLGLPPGNRLALRACELLLDQGIRRDGGINYGAWGNRGETCVTGMVLSILCHFEYGGRGGKEGARTHGGRSGKDRRAGREADVGQRLDTIAAHLLERQMPDGGWNCQRPYGATHASVHTTISVLEGLRLYELHRGRAVGAARAVQAVPAARALRAVRAAQRRGREFLLAHRLFRSHRTGEVIHPVLLRLAFPPRWHYDILRALDFFQAVEAPRDERLAEAIEVLRRKRRPDGRWNLEHRFRGRAFFEMERLGQPSRWNTLRALRVLRWWDRDGRG